MMPLVFCGGVLKSFNQGLLSAALAFMVLSPGVSARFVAVFSCIGAASQILSSLMVGWVAEWLGLRRALRLTALVAFLSVVLFCAPGGRVLWLCGNVSKGIYFGVVASLLPVVLSVGVSREKIGRRSGCFQLSQQLGGILGALAGAAIAWGFGLDPLTALRLDFVLMALPAILFAVSLKGVRDLPMASPVSRTPTSGGFADCGGAILFMVLMSACGSGTIMEYLAVVFLKRGLDVSGSCTVSAVVTALPVAAVALSTALADRTKAVHRVAFGAVGMTLGLAGAAISHGFLFVVCLALVAVSFAFGPGACAWGIVPHLIPPAFRARGTSLAIVSGQVVSLVLTTSFPLALESVGMETCFVAFAIMSAAMAVVAVAGGRKAGLV